MRMFETASFIALLCGPVLLAQQPQSQARQGNSAQAQARVSREVMHELATLAQYGVFDNLQFKTDGTTVTLIGYVTTPVLKTNAEKAVKDIEGVEKVDNKIEVLPVLDSDNAIRLATYRAIYGAPALERYALQAIPSIHIIVNRGNITLEGVVANQGDAEQALIRAKTVPGTFEVKSNLRVDAPAK